MKNISIVIPAYNEVGNLFEITKEIDQTFSLLPGYAYEIIFVNDGSRDDTQKRLEKLSNLHSNVKYIELSRNFGHQNAVKAGLDFSTGNAVISMDADLQHPPSLIPQMIKKWEEGYDVVYTIREYSANTGWFKRKTSDLFYKIMNKLSDVEVEEGSSDFRLMDASVVETLRKTSENDLFLRGLVKWMGFKQYAIRFVAPDRFSGHSKYNLKKMVKFAFTGVTAFSTKPLYIAAYLGFFFSLFTPFAYLCYILWAFYWKTEISGWASLIMTIVFFGGIQLIILGIMGIYMGKIFTQIKDRPTYIIRSKNF